MIPDLPWWAWVLIALAVWIALAIVVGSRVGRELKRLDAEGSLPRPEGDE